MAKRKGNHSHYEVMFEYFLRKNQVLYIAVDEKRKPIVDEKPIKNFDFIVSSFNGKYLVDIKGKIFAPNVWDNWVTEDDLSGLKVWGNHFNAFVPLLVIPYLVKEDHIHHLKDYADIRKHENKTYGIVAVTLAEFYTHARPRSKTWKAIYVDKYTFMKICKPLSHFIPEFKKDW